MPALSSLKTARPEEGTILWGDEQIVVVFDRNKVTPAWGKRLRASLESDDPIDPASGLLEVILGWDITDDAGAPLAPTVELIADLPTELIALFFEKIAEQSVPTRAEGEVSDATSSTLSTDSTSSPESLPDGLVPSPLPVP